MLRAPGLLASFVIVSLAALAPAGAKGPPRSRNPERNRWGYAVALPFGQLPTEWKAYYREAVPLEAVGAVKTRAAPFRATASYLGVHRGMHLFALSEHVADAGKPYAVELGHTGGGTFEVPLGEQPLFASAAGDVAIYRAPVGISADVDARLRALPPVRWLFAAPAAVEAAQRRATYLVAGRGIQGPAAREAAARRELWPRRAGRWWQAAEAEARQHLDERSAVADRQGDVLVVARPRLLARGLTQPLRDPDGLVIGSDTATPFLASRPDWSPVSLAGDYRSLGRMSGSPLFVLTREGPFVLGLHWTKGVAEDLRPLRPRLAADPTRAFGRVAVRRDAQGGLKLSLEQSAPFAYASSLERAGADLASFLSGTGAEALAPDERGALADLAGEALGNAGRVLGGGR